MTGMFGGDGAAGELRAGLLLLVVLALVGIALTLAYERHWLSAWQIAPWITLGIIGVAALALVVRQTEATVRLARVVAVLAIVSSALGGWQHIDANLNPDHEHGDQPHIATTSANGAEGQATPVPGHHGADEEATPAPGHHGAEGQATPAPGHHGADEEATPAPGHHGADEEATPTEGDNAGAEGMASTDPSLVDVLTGSAGSVPVPAALALAPVGLALGLATVGLGVRRRQSYSTGR